VSPDAARPVIVRRDDCRVCGAADLEEMLQLGPSPLANSFLESPAEFAAERTFPLDLYYCADCTLLQLRDVVDPAVMFRHYLYVTGTSTTIATHNEAYAQTLVDLLGLRADDLVVEIASNDGSLLQCFRRRGVRTLGVEPAVNLADRARQSGIDTVNEFFTSALAARLRDEGRSARVIAANNVLAHVDRPEDFLDGCRTLLADDGLITIEVPYAGEMLDRVEYDTIYHEHLSYFTVTSLRRLCDRVGLRVVRVDRVPVHGGSLRLYMSRSATAHAPDVDAMAAAERAGVADASRVRQFAADARRHRSDLLELLHRLAADGKRLAGYGAPAKGNTLLNYCGIDSTLLPFTVDRNPLKVGRFTPGTHIPVRPVDALHEPGREPDYVFILAWNFAAEIMEQQAAHRSRGGRFIVPIPTPQVV
jgi:hypothetical protein